jgi:soluble lytic murein transglycosylase-like protein
MHTMRRGLTVLALTTFTLFGPATARAMTAGDTLAPARTPAAPTSAPTNPAPAPAAPARAGDGLATVDSARAAAPAASPDSVRLIARLLAANGAPFHRAQPAAHAILKYSRLRSLDPLLVVGIIGVENATLTPRARSGVGASGVMQVMPSWKRDIKDCGADLREVHTNVCFGTRILQLALRESTTVREALLRYNGCVRAPGCHRYAAAVFSQAGRAVVLSRMEPVAAAPAVAVTPSTPAAPMLAPVALAP